MSDSSETLRHDTLASSELLLIPRFKTLRPGHPESIAILNRSANQMIITLTSEAPQDIVSLSFDPSTITLASNRQVEAEIRAVRASALAYPEGRTLEAHLRAYASDGTQGVTTITVELRPRYEWLASLLLLLGCAGAALVAVLVAILFASRPQPAPTVTPPIVAAVVSPTFTPTPTVTMTTPPPSITPTVTPSPTIVPPQTCEDKGWHRYTVEAGDTLEGVLQPREPELTEEAAAFNNLPPDKHVIVGQELCLPQIYKAKLMSLTVTGTPTCGVPFTANLTIKNIGTINWIHEIQTTSSVVGAVVYSQTFSMAESIPPQQTKTIPLNVILSTNPNQSHTLRASATVTGQGASATETTLVPNCLLPHADFTYLGSLDYSASVSDFVVSQQVSNLSTNLGGATYNWRFIIDDWYSPTNVSVNDFQVENPAIPLVTTIHIAVRVTVQLVVTNPAGTDTCIKVYRLSEEQAPVSDPISTDCN